MEVSIFLFVKESFWIEIDEVIDHYRSFFTTSFMFFQAGIGAGVETMSINPMALDKRVNPRVCYLM